MASRYIEACSVRSGLLLLLWWALTEGDLSGWRLALVVVLVATSLSLVQLPPPRQRMRWPAAPGFLAFFLREMLLGGIDVARRALAPRLPISPGLISYDLSLRRQGARLFMTWTASLLPGTVSVELRPQELTLHVLDVRMLPRKTLARLEAKIARLLDD